MFSEFIRWMLKYSLAWMLWMSFSRFVFGIYNIIHHQSISSIDFLRSMVYGLYMDVSLLGYVLIFVFLLSAIYHFTVWRPIFKIIKLYSLSVLILFTIAYAADIILYKDWGYKLDATPLFYLKKAGEVSAFISIANFISFIVVAGILFFSGLWIFRKLRLNTESYNKSLVAGFMSIICLPLLLIPIRGGVRTVPLSLSSVYFSKVLFANHMAVNTIWNIVYSVSEKDKLNSKFEYLSEDESRQIFSQLYSSGDSTVRVINTNEPNVLFIILESFTGKIIDYKLEGQEVTPNLNGWCREGIYFSDMYASADRTDEGLVALFSGFPSQPQSAIMNYPDKCRKLPSILSPFKAKGYNTRFYYGGDIDFANMGSYLLLMKMDSLIDKRTFPKNSYNAKWGVHDHIMFEKFYADLLNAKEPFFYSCISLSSHPPYDIPVKPFFKGNNEEISFLNTMHYTDEALGDLINKLKNNPVWSNLLVIITADHGAKDPGNSAYHLPERFKVPMIWMGGAVEKKFRYSEICSQTDFSRSILSQLDYASDQFSFSNNLLSKTKKEFAWYAFNNGFAYLSPKGHVIFSNDSKSVISQTDTSQASLKKGQAILQEVTKRYFEY